MSNKKLLTLEQLIKFCQENNFNKFSSVDTGFTLSVQVPGKISYSNDKDDTLMFVKVKVCHTDLNRNGSFISEENMKKAMPSLKYQPLLASFIDTENGKDFNSHDMELEEDADGNLSIKYIEQQVGAFTADDPYLEYDKDMDKTYVIANAAVPRAYTDAANIIERKNGTKVSCELLINSMSYNAKEKYLELNDFEFSGVTCLGEHVGEGMLGSRLDIADFSTENNSVKFEQNDKLVEALEKLNNTLSDFNIQAGEPANTKEGGNNKVTKFEELLLQYEKTVEDINFKYENLSDEELETAFAEAFAETEPANNSEPANDTECGNTENDPEPTDEFSIKYSVEVGEAKKNFSLSLNDKLNAMYSLIDETYGEADGEWYSVNMYDDEKIVEMYGMFTGKNYRQSYKVKKDTYSLVGDRVEVYAKYLSQDEINAFEKMKADFAELQNIYAETSDKLSKYEEEPAKMEILESADYSQIADTKEFVELKQQDKHFDMSVDEVRSAADQMLLSYAKTHTLEFTSTENPTAVVGKKLIPDNSKKVGTYGRLHRK